MRDGYETWLIVDGDRLKCGGSGSHRGQLGKLAPYGPRRLRLADHQRSVFAQQVDGAAFTEVDRLIHTLERVEVDDSLHDAVEASVSLLEAPRHDDRGPTLDLRDQRIAQHHAYMWMVPVSDEVRPIRKR